MALFPVPSNEQLMTRENWDQLDKHTYAVTRFHFSYREEQDGRNTYLGEIIDAYQTPAEIHVVSTEGVEIIVREQKVQEVGRQLIQEDGIVAGLSSGVKSSLLTLGASVQAAVQQDIRRQLSVTQTSTSISGVERTVKLKKKIEIEGGTLNKVFYSVQVFKRKKVQLWLRFMDFLTVELRGKRRYKRPSLKNNEHQNRIKLNLPVAEFIYYESLNPLNSAIILSQEEYQTADNVLPNPSEVLVGPPLFKCQPARLPSFRSYKTLYQLSDIAFPPPSRRK